MVGSVFRPLHRGSCSVQCSHCNLREICLPVGLTRDELERIDGRLVAARRHVSHGEALFRTGDRFDAVYAVWTGFFKTVLTSSDGRAQVTGFQMAGELIGLDAIDKGVHAVDAVALEDAQVCVMPFHDLAALGREIPSLQAQFSRLMSREIANDHEAMFVLGNMHAEERVAAFLLNLMHRLQARGFSSSSVELRMSREEIGSFLGLKLETVSRTLSKFQASGLLFVRQRHITITDPNGLRHLIDGVSV
ncbi:MAG TPA: helix-turn-helix domain-containing protein [Caldimonas sp.]|nr:helix-turn-helix domain-containing protein [Caldimonas sp.]